MRITKTKPSVRLQLRKINAAVEQSSERIQNERSGNNILITHLSFPTKAPRSAVYCPSSAFNFLYALEKLGFPRDAKFTDLGSGLGTICFTARLYFDEVVGFELDATLCNESAIIARMLGFDNVSFRNEDFLDTDLTPFRILFFFKPFFANFIPLMSKRMQSLKKGTIVIANTADIERSELFGNRSFRKIFSLEDDMAPDPVYGSGIAFCTYEKIA